MSRAIKKYFSFSGIGTKLKKNYNFYIKPMFLQNWVSCVFNIICSIYYIGIFKIIDYEELNWCNYTLKRHDIIKNTFSNNKIPKMF